MPSPQSDLQQHARRHRFRFFVSFLSIAFALPLSPLRPLTQPAKAQVGGTGQACYAIADNNPPGNPNGGRSFPDTLAIIDFASSTVTSLGTITGPSGPITNIEAATSRPSFNELIVANGSEIGRLDPLTASYTPLGVLAPFTDFDAIAIDRQSPSQTRLIGISKDPGNPNLNNIIVEATLEINSLGLTTGISNVTRLAAIPDEQFPESGDSIDGIAITNNGTVLGVSNRGPASPTQSSEQVLVIINIATGNLQRVGTFEAEDGTPINDVEDISVDLFDDLFISSGSNFSPSANTAYVIALNPDSSPIRARNSLSLASAGQDFEAAACLPTISQGNELLIVKRITAVTRNGSETRFNQFIDRASETTDNQLFEATNGSFPLGEVQAPTALLPGDEVEYTIYIYNPLNTVISDVILCDPIQPPSILQSSSVLFSNPTADSSLSFSDRADFARAPLAPADSACEAILTNDQFPSGPPGPMGSLDVGAGGGVVTDSFLLAPNQIAATRFRITVGQGSFE